MDRSSVGEVKEPKLPECGLPPVEESDGPSFTGFKVPVGRAPKCDKSNTGINLFQSVRKKSLEPLLGLNFQQQKR